MPGRLRVDNRVLFGVHTVCRKRGKSLPHMPALRVLIRLLQ